MPRMTAALADRVDKILTVHEVSELIRVPVATLRYWRHQGSGPKSFKLGQRRVVYRESDVVAWLEEQYNSGPAIA